MNLETFIKDQDDSVLWLMLADLLRLFGNKKVMEDSGKEIDVDTFWILLSKKITDELDRRLFADNEGEEDPDYLNSIEDIED